MNLHYQYYWFKEVIPHDVCDKIIKMGNQNSMTLYKYEAIEEKMATDML